MTTWLLERTPLAGLLLPVVTVLALLAVAPGVEHVALALVLAGALALTALHTEPRAAARLVSVRQRAEVCRQTGVRACDPDRRGRVRPRAPGLG